MLPLNVVFVPMVAELPTFQYTPAPAPVLMTVTLDPDEVISVLDV